MRSSQKVRTERKPLGRRRFLASRAGLVPDRLAERMLSGNAEVLDRVARSAADEDAGASVAESVDLVMSSSLLSDDSAKAQTHDLVALAEANLPLARLLEGHVNAIDLVRRLGGPERDGLHGVWGADADTPCTADRAGLLRGRKRFASGLGVVRHAVVSVREGDGTRLALVPAHDRARHDDASWSMTGMRATVSGTFDITGLEPVWLGRCDAYFEEPHFLGGVWRIAALQTGGTLGLLASVRDHLDALGRLAAEAQVARLAPLVGRAMAALGLVVRAAEVAGGPEGRRDPDRAVALSISARLLTEDLAQDAVAAAERAVGLAHFESASETGRRARDLATYCRQVARDALEQKAGGILLGRAGPLSRVWNG